MKHQDSIPFVLTLFAVACGNAATGESTGVGGLLSAGGSLISSGGHATAGGNEPSAGGRPLTSSAAKGGLANGGMGNGGRGNGGAMTGGAQASGGTANGGAPLGGGSAGGATNGGTLTGGTANGGTTIGRGGGSVGGSTATGGTVSSGGRQGTGGTTSASGGSGGAACGTLNPNPFGCKFAWGLADFGGSLASYGYLQFMTIWIDTGLKADGTFTTCSGCNWLKNSVAPTNLIPVYYAYLIGFWGHANGLVDGNQCPTSNPNCPNLTNQGAALIKSKRNQIVQLYAEYAKQSYAAWPTKPLVWLLEGDYMQYADSGQSSPLTLTELAQLAADITCAIKGNMPNAVVAMNHTTWNSNEETDAFWNAMKSAKVNYDLAWTTGVANNNGYFVAGTGPSTYNGATAKYSYLHQLTGKTIFVDDGCGAETNEDWSKGSASLLNGLIASGVIAFNHCGHLQSGYQSAITALGPQLTSTCP